MTSFSLKLMTLPYMEKLLIEGNKDGSMNVVFPKQASQAISLLVASWLSPYSFDVTYEEYVDKVMFFEQLGILIETPVFYEHLTACENLSIHLEYMDVKADMDKILSLVGLEDAKNKQVSKFSLGMKQKLAIARCISHNPKNNPKYFIFIM